MKKGLLFIAVLAVLVSCEQKNEQSSKSIRPVKTGIVESNSTIIKDFSGIVEAVEFVKLAFRVSGQIIDLPVIEGQKVKKGQLIAEIDTRDLALQYAADKSEDGIRDSNSPTGTKQTIIIQTSYFPTGL